MRKFLSFLSFFVCILFLGIELQAQSSDTTIVQTFTFADIHKREDSYLFPDASKKWEKVLMYYTLKCDAATPWDQYPCGEWDYLSYTVVYDSTGIIDTTLKSHATMEVVGNLDNTPDSVAFTMMPTYDIYQSWYKWTVVDATNTETLFPIGAGAESTQSVFPTTSPQSRTQYLWTAAELTTAGISAGVLSGIEMNISALGGDLNGLTIKMKQVNATSVTDWDNGGFTTVYQNNVSIAATGTQRFHFLTPFNWDGTSNVLVELSYENETAANTDFIVSADSTTFTSGIVTSDVDGYVYCWKDRIDINQAAAAFATIDSQITIAFWAYGDAILPQNTTIFEGTNADGRRVLNSHLPWDNSNMYWDAGTIPYAGTNRVNKTALPANIEGKWNHWAFTKNLNTGIMRIYLNGASWASGIGFTYPMGGVENFTIAKSPYYSSGADLNYYGGVNDFQLWDIELNASEVADVMKNSVSPMHPDYAHLRVHYDFDSDNNGLVKDATPNQFDATALGMPAWKNIPSTDLTFGASLTQLRPTLTFINGDYVTHIDSVLIADTVNRPALTIIHYDNPASPLTPTDTTQVYPQGYHFVYQNGIKVDSFWVNATQTLYQGFNTYETYAERINRIEVSRFITPYGIGLDLGADGFTWVYDVTDYAHLFHDWVRISSANTQELHDLKFVMIEGTPPRDVVGIKQVVDYTSYSYGSLAADNQMKVDTIALDPAASNFKVITRITGHGHEGIYDANQGLIHCCEWADKTHSLTFNGAAAPQISWDLLVGDKCSFNPVINQGGNWAPARDGGWCPAAPVDDKAFDVTQYVMNNQLVMDYGIEAVPANNPGQSSGNYVMTMHVVEYKQPNFALDATFDHILKPTKADFYSNINPICTKPSVIFANHGTTTLFNAVFNYGVVGGPVKTYTWNGNLPFLGSVEVVLPMTAGADWTTPNAKKEFYVEVVSINNGLSDEYPSNNRIQNEFDLPPTYANKFVVRLKNNALNGDVTVRIKGENGAIVYVKQNIPANALYNDTLNFSSPGCYFMEVTTIEELGLSYPLIPQVGSGSISFRTTTGALLEGFDPDFGKKLVHHFMIDNALPIEGGVGETHNQLKAYPNPTTGHFQIDAEANFVRDMNLVVTDVLGKVVYEQSLAKTSGVFTHEVDLTQLPSGLYFLSLSDGETTLVGKVIKE